MYPERTIFHILVSESLEKRIFHRHLTTVQLFDTFSLCHRHTISQQLKVKHCNFRYFGKVGRGWGGVIRQQTGKMGNHIIDNIDLCFVLETLLLPSSLLLALAALSLSSPLSFSSSSKFSFSSPFLRSVFLDI